VFSTLCRRLWARLSRRTLGAHESTPFVDDRERRLVRAPETPRRLDLHKDSGFGRDPPPRF